MIIYRQIKGYFFMDAFCDTRKYGKSPIGHTCFQIFVTEKGFLYDVPMNSTGDGIKDAKQFPKEVVAIYLLISDAEPEQNFQDMQKNSNEIVTTLRVPEEGITWSNKDELYIGLIKESVRKDMKYIEYPLLTWYYCVDSIS